MFWYKKGKVRRLYPHHLTALVRLSNFRSLLEGEGLEENSVLTPLLSQVGYKEEAYRLAGKAYDHIEDTDSEIDCDLISKCAIDLMNLSGISIIEYLKSTYRTELYIVQYDNMLNGSVSNTIEIPSTVCADLGKSILFKNERLINPSNQVEAAISFIVGVLMDLSSSYPQDRVDSLECQTEKIYQGSKHYRRFKDILAARGQRAELVFEKIEKENVTKTNEDK